MSDVLVIGAGPGGLLSSHALLKKGFNVSIYEEHSNVGLPKHCSGLVSSYVVNSLGPLARDQVLSKFTEYRVRVIEKGLIHDQLILSFREPVYLIDRVGFEASLREAVESYGGKLRLRTRVTEARVDEGLLRTKEGWAGGDLIIVSEGALRTIVRKSQVCDVSEALIGPQALVRLGRVSDTVEVITFPPLGVNGFGWVIPVDDKHVVVGLVTNSKAAGRLLKYIVHKVAGELSPSDVAVREFFGGLVPVDKPCRELLGSKHIVVGDAASIVKPLTKGGLYPLVKEVEALETSLRGEHIDIDLFNARFGETLRLLNTQHATLKAIRRLGGYHNLVKLAVKLGLREIKLMDYDRLVSLPAVS